MTHARTPIEALCRKSPAHVKGHRTRKRNAARLAERSKVFEMARAIRAALHLPADPRLERRA